MVIKRNDTLKEKESRIVKVSYNFDYNTLSLFLAFILSSNTLIKRSELTRLNNLMQLTDRSIFESDPTRLKLYDLINKGLEARIDKRLNNKLAVLTYLKGGVIEDSDELLSELNQFSDLEDAEIEYVSKCITDALNCALVENNMTRMKQLTIEYDMADYGKKSQMIPEIENLTTDMNAGFRNNKSLMKEEKFSFDPTRFEDDMSALYDDITSPGRFMRSQLMGLNLMLGGGFESKRFYLILGNTGVGKSKLLLNLALQFRFANRYYKCQDPNKKPVVLFLTQENFVTETVERIFKIIHNSSKMADMTKEEIMDILINEGHMAITNEFNIILDIVYKPDRSINTNDLANMIEDYAMDGKEVVAVFQDHIKRIRSIEGINDQRLELGAVVNEMKAIAIRYNIPIISVSHLNRDAARVIDENATSNKYDLTRMLGRSNIGESYLMMDNADATIIIGAETDEDGHEWMAFNLLKLRYAEEKLKYMAYPMMGIKVMVDDGLDEPIYKTTLRPDVRPINGTSSFTQNSNSIFSDSTEIKSMDDLISDEGFGIKSESFSIPVNSETVQIQIPIDNISIEPESDKEPIQLVQWDWM